MPATLFPRHAYTPAEFGATFGLRVARVWALIRSGELRAGRIGKLYRIPAAEVERFCAELDRSRRAPTHKVTSNCSSK